MNKFNWVKIKLKLKKFFTEELWQHAIVIAFVSFCGIFFNKIVEAVLFYISHWVIRHKFDKQYHCGTTSLCLITTLTISFFGIIHTLPFGISLLSTIPICCFISWVGYIAQDRIDLLKFKKKKEEFNLETCTREQVIDVCKLLHYKRSKIQLAILFFAERMSVAEVFDWLEEHSIYYDYDTVKQYKYLIKKDLLKYVK